MWKYFLNLSRSLFFKIIIVTLWQSLNIHYSNDQFFLCQNLKLPFLIHDHYITKIELLNTKILFILLHPSLKHHIKIPTKQKDARKKNGKSFDQAADCDKNIWLDQMILFPFQLIRRNSHRLAAFAGHFLPLCNRWKSPTQSKTSGNRKFSTALPRPTALQRTNVTGRRTFLFLSKETKSTPFLPLPAYTVIFSRFSKNFEPTTVIVLKIPFFLIANFLRNLLIKLKIRGCVKIPKFQLWNRRPFHLQRSRIKLASRRHRETGDFEFPRRGGNNKKLCNL